MGAILKYFFLGAKGLTYSIHYMLKIRCFLQLDVVFDARPLFCFRKLQNHKQPLIMYKKIPAFLLFESEVTWGQRPVELFLQVYTSGKGSSAAGLTASVNRDPGSVIKSFCEFVSLVSYLDNYHYSVISFLCFNLEFVWIF